MTCEFLSKLGLMIGNMQACDVSTKSSAFAVSSQRSTLPLATQPALCRRNQPIKRKSTNQCTSGSASEAVSSTVTVSTPATRRHPDACQRIGRIRAHVWQHAAAAAVSAALLLPTAGTWPAAAAADTSTARFAPSYLPVTVTSCHVYPILLGTPDQLLRPVALAGRECTPGHRCWRAVKRGVPQSGSGQH